MRFWPAVDPVQLEYERLREMALAGVHLLGPEAERFQGGACWRSSGDQPLLSRT
jgi:hypothetical protein